MSDRFWHWMNTIHAIVTKMKLTKTEQKALTLTHTALDGAQGGKFVVPEAQSQAFLEHYVEEIVRIRLQERVQLSDIRYLYFNEYRTPVFRMLFDLDLIQATILSEADELKIYKVMDRVIRTFYPRLPPAAPKTTQTFAFLVTGVVEPKQFPATDPKRPNWVKIGRHGVYPYLYVNASMAMAIREAWIVALETELGVRPSDQANPWADVVDGAVYTANGLRMTYSHKAEKCECAKQQAQQRSRDKATLSCEKCCGRGFCDVGREYVPLTYIVNGKPSPQNLKQYVGDTVEAIRCTVNATSVRLVSEDQKITPGFEELLNCPVPAEHDTVQVANSLEFKEDMQTRKRFSKRHTVLENTSAEVRLLRTVIRKYLPPAYHKVLIKQVEVPSDFRYYHILLRGEGSTYCMNLGGNHRNNTAYFVVKRDGISQKCHCRCTHLIGRKFGLCSKFESQKFMLPNSIVATLFDRSEADTTVTTTAKPFGYVLHPEVDKVQSQINQEYVAVKRILARLSLLISNPNMQQSSARTAKRRRIN